MKTISRICAACLAMGMLTALSACAGSGLIKITHSDTPYMPSTGANAQPVVSRAKTPEVQVAVLANSPTNKAPRRAVFIHR